MNDELLVWQGHRVRVVQTGAGDPLLLLSGLGCHAGMWTSFAEQFADRRIIRFDMPGTGLSSTPLYPLSIAALAKLAVAVLDHCAAPYADVVGFSLGGAVAQQIAYEYPGRVRRLVLAGTTCGVGSIFGSMYAMSALTTPLRLHSQTYFEQVAAGLYGGATGRDAAIRAQIARARSTAPSPSYYGYAMQLLGANGWSSLPFLAEIPHETLVISGDDDPLVPVENARILANAIPRARLAIVKRAGHLFLWDDTRNAAARIRPFIDGEAQLKRGRVAARKRTRKRATREGAVPAATWATAKQRRSKSNPGLLDQRC